METHDYRSHVHVPILMVILFIKLASLLSRIFVASSCRKIGFQNSNEQPQNKDGPSAFASDDYEQRQINYNNEKHKNEEWSDALEHFVISSQNRTKASISGRRVSFNLRVKVRTYLVSRPMMPIVKSSRRTSL